MDWKTIPLYRKILLRGSQLSKEHSEYLDKIKAKKIVQSIIPTLKVAKLVKTFVDPEEFMESDISSNYLLKASRGSGLILDLGKIQNTNFAHASMLRWKQTLMNKKRSEFLIEEKIHDAVLGKTGQAVDYKFFCFHGKPQFFLVRHSGYRNFYYSDYTPMKLDGRSQLPPIDIKPMLEIASILSSPMHSIFFRSHCP